MIKTLRNILTRLKKFFVSPINGLKDTKELNSIGLLEEAKMDLNILQELKSSCDMFDETLNSQAYHMYTFMENTNKEELKTYLMPKFVHVIDKYHDLEKVFFL